MFENTAVLPDDPILGLISRFAQDKRENKVDLGVGVYRNEDGQTPVLSAIKQAEQHLVDLQKSKSYLAPQGNMRFLDQLGRLVFGSAAYEALGENIACMQTIGGCGALRIAAEVILRSAVSPKPTIWVSTPTWGNHEPLIGGVGLHIKRYPYFDFSSSQLLFDEMVAFLDQVSRNDVVLFHGSCHNPTGVDLTPSQWQVIADLAQRKGFIPCVDLAYQGFGDGVDQDAESVRILARSVPEVLVCVSCSKNFALYRERVGAVYIKTDSLQQARAINSQMINASRGIYSMPPDHGAEIVAQVLENNELKLNWLKELSEMRERINDLRGAFSSFMRDIRNDHKFDFIAQQKGMFSFLGLSDKHVAFLIQQKGIYLMSSSRASIPGLNKCNLRYVCVSINEALNEVLES